MEKTATISGAPLPIRFQTVLRASSRPLVRCELPFVVVSAICASMDTPSTLPLHLKPPAPPSLIPFLSNLKFHLTIIVRGASNFPITLSHSLFKLWSYIGGIHVYRHGPLYHL